MIFFEDFKLIKNDMSIGITSLLSNITTREGSHKGGWARLLKCQLTNLGHSNVKILDNKDSLSDFDVIIFDLGAEYSGTLNLFGGLDAKVFKRLQELKDFAGPIFSWRHSLPNVTILDPRRQNESTCGDFKATSPSFLHEVQQVLETCQIFYHAYRTESLLIGDSHTPSVWTPDWMIERRDGRTLKGMLERKTVQKYVNQYKFAGHDINKVQVHCGSIDIRHHVHRELNPDGYVVDLATELLNQLMQVSDATLVVTHTMGIEDESRTLPKTGYFKGTAYAGTWEQRNQSRNLFNQVMDSLIQRDTNTKIVKLPNYFFDESGKLRFEVMEKPQSIHLSPEHYRWNLDTNKDRWIHEEGR